ncbi:MAG: hypothetical protein M5U19_14960 [Microthrixaceae bacterium]|nr:hypothetical protein [Microthrixaceae bacterium]
MLETSRGSKSWRALVEVKTGSAELERAQIETYLDVARDNDVDAVITVSNQLAPAPGVHPVDVDRRKLRKVQLYHLSWTEILTAAVQQRVHRGVADPEQAWILGELIRYLEHPKSGALDFSDMGPAWVSVREAVVAGTLRGSDRGLTDVVSRWDQLLRFAALRLGRELGIDVQVRVSRRDAAEPARRLANRAAHLVKTGTFTGALRVPDAVADIEVTADLRASKVTVAAEVGAPREGRQATRVNWLLRQLAEAPGALRVDALTTGSRSSLSDLLTAIREDPAVLVPDKGREIRAFRIAASSPLGTKRGTGRGAFIDSVLASIDGFYETAIQNLRAWSPKAPQLPTAGRTAVATAGIDVTPPSSDVEGAGRARHDGVQTPDTPAADLVTWNSAHQRLDSERRTPPDDVDFDTTADPVEPGSRPERAASTSGTAAR